MSKVRDSWETPDDLFGVLNTEFDFDLDVACSADNKKCQYGISEDVYEDGRGALSDSCTWFAEVAELGKDFLVGKCFQKAWCNPPYSNPLPWVQKAIEQVNNNAGSVVVMLLNHDASTQWYSLALTNASEIRIMTEKRVQFVAPEGVKPSSNSKGQCIIVFRKKQKEAPCHTWHWDWQKSIKGD